MISKKSIPPTDPSHDNESMNDFLDRHHLGIWQTMQTKGQEMNSWSMT